MNATIMRLALRALAGQRRALLLVGLPLLLVVTAVLVLVITLGGWSQLQGAIPVAFAYVLLFLLMAYYVHNWNRGVLPVVAVLAVLLLVIAAVAAPA